MNADTWAKEKVLMMMEGLKDPRLDQLSEVQNTGPHSPFAD